MKILLVEDEKIVRNHIKEILVGLGYEDTLEADNGVDAMNILSSQNVDVILSDIEMPIMNGLALLSKINETMSSNAIFIILSAYDRFDYAQEAIRSGVFSYLLKPVKVADLESIMTLASSQIHKRLEEQSNTNQMINNYNKSIKQQQMQFLRDLIVNDSVDNPTLQTKLSDLSLSLPHPHYIILLINIDTYNTSGTAISYQDEHLYRFSINNIFSEIMNEVAVALHPFNYASGVGYLLNLNNEMNFTDQHPMHKHFSNAKSTIDTLLNITISIAISHTVNDIKESHKAFQTAEIVMTQKLTGKSDLFYMTTDGQANNFTYVLDFNDEKRLLACFEKNSVQDAIVFIDELFDQISEVQLIDSKKLNTYYYQLIILLIKITKQFHLDSENVLGDEYILYTQVTALPTIPDMRKWFIDLIHTCFDALNQLFDQSGTNSIYKAKTYIDANCGTDLTLESVAAQIYMSPEHFSRLFKKTFDSNFSHYLSAKRMALAKELLTTTPLKVSAIAAKAGFNDTKYFSKVFKNHVGMTPSHYRKAH